MRLRRQHPLGEYIIENSQYRLCLGNYTPVECNLHMCIAHTFQRWKPMNHYLKEIPPCKVTVAKAEVDTILGHKHSIYCPQYGLFCFNLPHYVSNVLNIFNKLSQDVLS